MIVQYGRDSSRREAPAGTRQLGVVSVLALRRFTDQGSLDSMNTEGIPGTLRDRERAEAFMYSKTMSCLEALRSQSETGKSEHHPGAKVPGGRGLAEED
ncbi:hypothetical protein E4U53_007875 [Claviceps sorghi]|nr:hypothetical protein E4U53_007875 [Claviceps sorghi]